MGIFDSLFGKKNKSRFSNEELIEAGACPNCWGRQEYEGAYKDYVQDQTKANINQDKAHSKAFVQQFVETHITGIQLKKDGDYQVCPTCKSKYKFVSSKAS